MDLNGDRDDGGEGASIEAVKGVSVEGCFRPTLCRTGPFARSFQT
jgi:hypothetical protein